MQIFKREMCFDNARSFNPAAQNVLFIGDIAGFRDAFQGVQIAAAAEGVARRVSLEVVHECIHVIS